MIVWWIVSHTFLFAAENNGRGTKAIGMANAFAAVSDNCWAINYNPAGLARLTSFQCAAFIVPEQFGLQELKTTAFAAAAPFSFAAIGCTAEKFGFDLYSETEFGLAFARKIDGNISAGLNLEYQRRDILRYGTAGTYAFHAGLLAHVLENLDIGFTVHNSTNAALEKGNEKIPQVCALGICWSFFHEFQISLEMEKDIRFPASIKMGVEQIVFSTIALRAGAANNPDKYSAGIAVRYLLIEFGYAGYSHPDLGWTHQVELSFKFDK
jgi:hypothetical protein